MAKPPWTPGGEGGAMPVVSGFNTDTGVVGDHVTSDNTISLFGTADANVEVRIYADGVLLGTTTSDADGNWSFTTAELADGTYSFTAQTGEGDHTQTSEPFEITVDTVTPEPEVTEATETADGLVLSGTAEAGASVDIYRDGVFLGVVTADSSGIWSYTDSGYAGGNVVYTVTATDVAGNSAETEYSYPNAAPTITSAATVSVPENETAVLDLTATDDNDAEGAGLTYTISGGADVALFAIDETTGELSFKAAPDFEAPGDADGDNVYEVQVTVTDSEGLSDTQDMAVTVTDVEENTAPVLDLDGSADGSGYSTTFTENGAAVAVADTDVLITDDDDTHLVRATVVLTNPAPSDELIVDAAALPSGIAVDPSSTATTIILTGSASLADYQAALQQVLFRNTSETPSGESRTVEVTVEDGDATSNVATATIAVDRAPDAVDDSATTQMDTAVTTDNVLANDDEGDAPAVVSSFDAQSVAGGSVAYNGDGTFHYTPPAGFSGGDSFTYTIEDTDGDMSTATVHVDVSGSEPTVFTTQVASGDDDVEEGPSGSVKMTSSDLELVVDGSKVQLVGIRFAEINIPQGATIVSAYIQFQADEVSTGAASLTIHGEASDDASAFTGVRYDVSARTLTGASVNWSPADWSTKGEAGPDQRTPDLASVIQEIVNRSGWDALNDMVFVISGSGTRVAEAYEGAGGPVLYIEWLPASDPVAFDDPADADSTANQLGELAAAGALIGVTASATDPDTGDTVTYSIDDSRFTIDPDTGVVTRSNTGTLDHESEPTVTFTVTAASSDGSAAQQAFSVDILDDPEPAAFNDPPDADESDNWVKEDAAAGTSIGITASAMDSDAGDTITYSIDDTRFTIDPDTGVITRSGTGTLDADAEPEIIFTVTATSSDGSDVMQDYTVSVTANAPTVFTAQVASGDDDVEEGPSGSVKMTSSDLELVVDGSKVQLVGIRFTDINVPQGATIVSAYLQFQADEVSIDAASLLIQGESSDDAAAFTGVRYDVSARTLTDASVNWSPAEWLTKGEAGPDQRTPDLAAVIQEIVNRSGWAALNDMVFVISGSGTRVAEAFEGAGGPVLYIEWLPASDPVAFDDPADADSTANQLGELAAAGTLAGITASASDPDGSEVTYSIDDERFAIDPNTGVVTRSATGTLDHEGEPSVTFTVTATSSDGSTAQQAFAVDVLDDPEAVTFDDPPDSDGAADRIAETAEAGTSVGITASASDTDVGDSVSYEISDTRFVIDPTTGVITRSDTGTLDADAEPEITFTVTATSTDGSVATQDFTVNVTNGLPSSVTLVRTTLTSEWSPPSPDPSGIAYISHLGVLLISDGEVNEISNLFTGDNLFKMQLNGEFAGSLTAIGFSDEPTGVAYNPQNRHLFFTDDTGTRSVYELDPGPDGDYDTSDDVVTSFATGAFGSKDPEGITYDTNRGVLYISDGSSAIVYTVDPGPNGRFDGVPAAGGDDIVTSFDAGALGIKDPEGVEYDSVFDILYIIASRDAVAMVTPTGELLGLLDISEAGARNPAGLALAPSSGDATQTSLYLADRGVDNNSDPDENDGKVYEFMFDQWLVA